MRIPFMARALAVALLAAPALPAAAQPVPDSLFRRLDYEVRESGPLRFAGRERATVQLREQVPGGAPAGGEGVLEVFPVMLPPPGTMEELAQAQLARLRGVQGLTVRPGRRLVLDDLPAYELIADARDSAGGAPVVLYQVMVPERSRLVVLQGRVGADREQRLLPHFRQVAESFRRTAVLRARLGGVAYEVTGGYQPVPELSDAGIAIYRDPRTHSGLFVAVLGSTAERDSVAGEVARRLFAAETPGHPPQGAKWRLLGGHRISRFELHQERRHGRAGDTMVMVVIRHLRHDGRDFLTGYSFATETPNSESYPAGEASAWLIRSAVGEGPEETFRPPPMRDPLRTTHPQPRR
jgi:hypothetical protein